MRLGNIVLFGNAADYVVASVLHRQFAAGVRMYGMLMCVMYVMYVM